MRAKAHGQPLFSKQSLNSLQHTRGFLTDSPLSRPITNELHPISPDPLKFGTLDHVLTPKAWLPSVTYALSRPHVAFPSDHFLVEAGIQIKLGAPRVSAPRKPKLDYTAGEATQHVAVAFNDQFRKHFAHGSVAATNSGHTANNLLFVGTDGSGSSGKATPHTRAGWGFVISHDRIGEHIFSKGWGGVVTDHRQAQYLGARVGSNNTGELTALCEAMLWALERNLTQATMHILYDSKWAANMARGIWKPKTGRTLVRTAQRIYKMLMEKGILFNWEWVKGHQGQALNEVAGRLAEQGKQEQTCKGGRHDNPRSTWLDPTAFSETSATQQDPFVNESLDSANDKITRALNVAETVFPKLAKVPNKPWISQVTLQLIAKSKQARAANDPQEEAALHKQIRSQARKDRKQWLHDKLQLAEEQKDPSGRDLFASVKSMRKGFSPQKGTLKKNGKLQPFSQRNQVMRDHLEQVQWGHTALTTDDIDWHHSLPTLHESLEIETGLFTFQELETAIMKMKRLKAPGPDDIPAELLMHLDNYNRSTILALMNKCWVEGKIPISWKKANVACLYKKGDDSLPSNYRPISLLSVLYKLLARMIQIRMATSLDHLIRATQHGFRQKRSTQTPVHLVCRAQELFQKTGKPLFLMFLDWKISFDRIDHTALLQSLRRMGLPSAYLNIVSDIYREPCFTVQGLGLEGQSGTCSAGIRQGCPLSPYLSVIGMSLIMQDAEKLLRNDCVPLTTWSKYKEGFDCEYADDTLLVAQTTQQMQSIFAAVEKTALRYGLHLNKDKTLLLRCLDPLAPDHTAEPLAAGHTANIDPVLFSDGSNVPQTFDGSVIYLGAKVSTDCRQNPNITMRLGKATSEFKKLSNVWNSTLSKKLRVKIFMAIFPPMITYSLQTVVLGITARKQIDAWFYRHLRKVLRIKASYYSRISNAIVFRQSGLQYTKPQQLDKLTLKLLHQQLFSDTDDPLFHVSLTASLQDKVASAKQPNRGRPRDHWLKQATQLASYYLGKTTYAFTDAYKRWKTVKGRPIATLIELRSALKQEGYLAQLMEAPTRAHRARRA